MTVRRQAAVSLVMVATVASIVVPAHAASGLSAVWNWAPSVAHRTTVSALAAGRLGASPAARALSAWPRRGVPRVGVPLPQTVALSASTRTLYATGDTGVVSV